MNICMIGTGYVGLVTGACLAEMGNNVICVDNQEKKIESLNSGILPIYEPGLQEIVNNNVREKRLSFTTNLRESVDKSSICFIAVGTPQDVDGSADLSYVLKVAKDIGKIMIDDKIVVTKSTVPVGTSKKVEDIINKQISERKFAKRPEVYIVSNPEFLKEGNAVQDFMKPDRVVIGTSDKKIADIFKELYEPFMKTTGNPILIMDNLSAELTKYAANSFLAIKISFINEISILCDKVGADISKVREGIGTDERIGHRFLLPGPGYGGSCFPKDIKALIKTAKDNDCNLKISKAAQDANEYQKKYFASKVIEFLENDKDLINIGIWGLTFKPKTDDVRESPALDIIEYLYLTNKFKSIKVYDPMGMENAQKILGDKVIYCEDSYDAIKDVDALIILTDWNQFKSPDFKKMKDLMNDHVILDGRNILNMDDVISHGFLYYGVGRSRNKIKGE